MMFIATGRHVDPDYDKVTYHGTVHKNADGTWYVTARKLGCGKDTDCKSPEQAIEEMLRDHGYTQPFVTIVPPSPLDGEGEAA